MVTFVTAAEPDLQVVGTPSKNLREDMFQELQGFDPIYYIPDPDVSHETITDTARHFKGHDFFLVRLPVKIDDLINWDKSLDKVWLNNTLREARKARV